MTRQGSRWRAGAATTFRDLLLGRRLHRLPPPLMLLALRRKFWIAAGVKGILRDGGAQSGSYEHVGGPVIPSHETRDGHRDCGSIREHSRPRFGIFVGEHRGHGKCKHRMSAGERGVHRVMFEEVSVPIAFSGTL